MMRTDLFANQAFAEKVDGNFGVTESSLLVKPNALTPLRESPSRHPYMPEIENLTFSHVISSYVVNQR
jgi:hypothetical protein